MKNYNQEKTKLVNSVFTSVNKKYDIMNDILSFGTHRLWKRKLLEWISPSENENLIDVAAGTGDLAKLYSNQLDSKCEIQCVEPNKEMLNIGKNKLIDFKNISWHQNSAENLPFKDNVFDYYTISFGIRNVTDINKCLGEAYRVLKPGGRFFCLEFSKVQNETLSYIYKYYSKLIPGLGKIFAGDSAPSQYLVDSIEKFYSQKELKNLIENNDFENVQYRNLANGISAIHSGWKI